MNFSKISSLSGPPPWSITEPRRAALLGCGSNSGLASSAVAVCLCAVGGDVKSVAMTHQTRSGRNAEKFMGALLEQCEKESRRDDPRYAPAKRRRVASRCEWFRNIQYIASGSTSTCDFGIRFA